MLNRKSKTLLDSHHVFIWLFRGDKRYNLFKLSPLSGFRSHNHRNCLSFKKGFSFWLHLYVVKSGSCGLNSSPIQAWPEMEEEPLVNLIKHASRNLLHHKFSRTTLSTRWKRWHRTDLTNHFLSAIGGGWTTSSVYEVKLDFCTFLYVWCFFFHSIDFLFLQQVAKVISILANNV